MKKKNWFALLALSIIISMGMSSCYYGMYGPPRPPRPHHHGHGHGHGHHHGHGGYR